MGYQQLIEKNLREERSLEEIHSLFVRQFYE